MGIRFAAIALVAALVVGAAEAAAFFGWQVTDISADDVLMVRASPSSDARILVGYPSGTPLSLTGTCTGGLDVNTINGLAAATQAAAVRDRWCEVWLDPIASGNFQTGWVFGRYIRPL